MPKPDRLDAYRKIWKTCKTNQYWTTHRLDKANTVKGTPETHKEAIKTAIEGWAEVDVEKLVYADISGKSNNKTFRVTAPEGSEPLTVILHVNTIAEDDKESAERERDAQKALAEVCPQRLNAEEVLDVVVEGDGGKIVSAEKTHKDFAELLANVHKTDAAWFDAHKEKIGEKLAPLKEATAGAPVWWFALHPLMLKGISDEKLTELAADFVEPISEAGKKVVTCHGDFHKGNI